MISRVQIEITNHCNNRCIYCPHKNMKREKGFMSFENFEFILKECKRYGVKEVYSMLNGEPTIHPDFIKMSKLIKQYGFKYPVITNLGRIKNADLIELSHILDSNDCLTISLDTVNKEIYEKIRGSNYESVMENLKVLKSLKWKCHVSIQIIKTKFHTDEDIQNTRNFFKGTPFGVGTGEILNWGGAIESSVVNKRQMCSRLSNDICIMVNGDIPLCCIDYEGVHNFGNIFKDSLDVIDSKRESFIKEFPKGLCINCNGKW